MTRPAALLLAILVGGAAAQEPAAVSGDAVIRGKAGDSEIVVTTTSRLAGAVHSLTWGGREFIDSLDHGRQLQSACAFDCGDPKNFWAESYNPTEAGSRGDHVGPTSTSRLLELKAAGNRLRTRTRMAFWTPPGEQTSGRPAKNTGTLSDVELLKDVTVGVPGFPHAIDYRVTFRLPPTEKHTLAQLEALTGYMPPAFASFQALDPATGKLSPIGAGPGEQAKPLIFSTADGSHAMGAWCPAPGASYGRWNFKPEKVVKWNVVFRVKDAAGVPPGDYAYRVFVAVGSVPEVRKTLIGLMQNPPD